MHKVAGTWMVKLLERHALEWLADSETGWTRRLLLVCGNIGSGIAKFIIIDKRTVSIFNKRRFLRAVITSTSLISKFSLLYNVIFLYIFSLFKIDCNYCNKYATLLDLFETQRCDLFLHWLALASYNEIIFDEDFSHNSWYFAERDWNISTRKGARTFVLKRNQDERSEWSHQWRVAGNAKGTLSRRTSSGDQCNF